MASNSDGFELDNENANDDASPSGEGEGARYNGIMPEVVEAAAKHRASRGGGRNSLPWSRPTASPRGSAFLPQADMKRRSLGSMASVCNAATIQIPDFVSSARMSMESTCSNVRTSFSVPVPVDFCGGSEDGADTTVESFEAAVWNLLQGVLQAISEEYAQRLATLQSESLRDHAPVHCSEDSSSPDVATSAKVAPPTCLPIESRAGQVASQSAENEATDHQAGSSKVSPAAISDANAASVGSTPSKAEKNRKAWKRAATAPALADDGEDSRPTPEHGRGLGVPNSEPFKEVPSNNSGHTHHSESMEPKLDHHALFHHGHLEVPKNFISSACSSARSSFHGEHHHQEPFCSSTRSSARGSHLVTRGMRHLEALAVGASHHHRHLNQAHDTINKTHVDNMAHDMLGASHSLGNSLEAELDAVLAAQSRTPSPWQQRGSFNADATRSRTMLQDNSAPSPRSASKSTEEPERPRGSMERAMDAQMDMLVTKMQSEHVDDEAYGGIHTAHAPPPLPSAVASGRHEEDFPQAGDECLVGQVGTGPRRMQTEYSMHSGSSKSSQCHVFEVLPVYETRQKSLRVTRNQTSLTFGFECTSDSEDSEDDDGRCGMRSCCKSEYTLRPNSFIKIIWDMIGFLLISYDFVMIPMQFFDPSETGFLWHMAWIVRIYWTCDFPISLISAYEHASGVLERRLGRVVCHYCQTWALFDICILTLDYLENAVEGLSGLGAARAGKIGKSIRLLRMFRVIRMLRRNTLPEPLKQVTYKLQSEQYQILFGIWRIIIFLLGLVHLIACCWYGVGSGDHSSWVHKYFMENEALDWRYTTSFHWSLTQFAGSMDVQPHNVGDRLFAIFALIIGFLVSAVVVSSITSSMTRLQIVLAHESTQKSLLNNYLVDNGISTKLALRVQRNASHAYQQDKKNLPESSIELLQLVSEPLRVEVHYEMYMPVLTAHPFFQLYNQMSPSGMRNLCHSAVCRIQLALGDVLFTAGETPQTPWMYFLTSGLMQYFQENVTPGRGAKPTSVGEGQWACEPVLWTPWIHHGTMRAKTELILMGLRAGSFQDIMCRFQSREFTPKSYAEEYVGHLNEVEMGELTDLAEPAADLLEYCQKAIEKCTCRMDPSKRSLASSTISSGGRGGSGVESRVAELNSTVNNMNSKLRGSKKSIASSVASMFTSRLPRSSTARSLSIYSNRSTTRSTTRSQMSRLLSRTKSRLSVAASPSHAQNPKPTTFDGLTGSDGFQSEGEACQQSSEPQVASGSVCKPFVIDSEEDLDTAR